MSPGLLLAVSPGCFLAVSPGCFLAASPGGFSGCVARFVTDCVVRWFLAGFARVCFPDVCQCVIAQDRASLNIEQVN